MGAEFSQDVSVQCLKITFNLIRAWLLRGFQTSKTLCKWLGFKHSVSRLKSQDPFAQVTDLLGLSCVLLDQSLTILTSSLGLNDHYDYDDGLNHQNRYAEKAKRMGFLEQTLWAGSVLGDVYCYFSHTVEFGVGIKPWPTELAAFIHVKVRSYL